MCVHPYVYAPGACGALGVCVCTVCECVQSVYVCASSVCVCVHVVCACARCVCVCVHGVCVCVCVFVCVTTRLKQ